MSSHIIILGGVYVACNFYFDILEVVGVMPNRLLPT